MFGVRQPALATLLPAVFIIGLLGLSTGSRVAGVPGLEATFLGTAALLGLWYIALLARARARGQRLLVEFNAVRTHYVQALVQSSVYLYWATAWPFIAGQFPLIFAQWCFVYACTMLIAWTRRGKAEVGFGPLPIILSTNFFLCFKDEWFYPPVRDDLAGHLRQGIHPLAARRPKHAHLQPVGPSGSRSPRSSSSSPATPTSPGPSIRRSSARPPRPHLPRGSSPSGLIVQAPVRGDPGHLSRRRACSLC